MSRYDGLIIPRSYNEYINKSDPLTLAQALQQNNVLSAAVAAGDNKAVKSAAVATALANYLSNIPKSNVTDCNEAPAGLFCNKGVSNAPGNRLGFIYLFTLSYDGNADYRIQICFAISETTFFRRVKSGGTWGQWSSI